MIIDNIIVGYLTSNAVTVYTTGVVRKFKKTLIVVQPPNSTNNQTGGSKDTMIIDLQRNGKTIEVDGYIASADINKLVSMHDVGDSTNPAEKFILPVRLNGVTYKCNMESLDVDYFGRQEQDEIQVKITFIVGANK